jgi:Fe-S-cluster-containing dehydrogenase component/formate-dependent nitrite reductase membrane component NrfD
LNYGFIIDNRKCIGCHACTVACKAEHDVPLGVNRTWVKYVEKGEFPDTRRFFSVMRCNHCDDAPCVTICPVTALYTREDGIVDFDGNRCIGCKACIQGCPYDAIHIDPDLNTAAKCNYCAHRVEVNLEPPCAVVCPEHAIIAGDMDDPSTEIATMLKMNPVQVRKPEKGTQPKVFYIGADEASLNPSATSTEDSYISSQGREPGVTPRQPSAGLPVITNNNGGNNTGELSDEIWEKVKSVMGEKAIRAGRVYDTGQTHQDSWGWKVAAYLWTKSIAAGALLLAPFIGGWGYGDDPGGLRMLAVALSLLFLTITGVLLVTDLKKPSRFLWVLTRPQWKSWLTRGSYILLGFGAAATGLGAALVMDNPALWNWLAIPAILFAVGGAVYTAFLFWQSKGRDFWQSPLLPLHLFVQAVTAGLAILLFGALVLGKPVSPLIIAGLTYEGWLIAALAVNLVMILTELLATHQTADAAAAAKWSLSGSRLQLLLWGVLAAGHLAPVALLARGDSITTIAGSVLALAGLLAYEHLYVRAGQSVALS